MMDKPKCIKFAVVCVRKDEDRNAWLVKAEGKMGSRISWFSYEKPSYAPGDELAIEITRRSHA